MSVMAMPSMFHVLSVVRRALGLVVRLLAGFGAADVHAVDDDARHRLEHDPGIARRRNVLQLVERHVRGDGLPLRFDDGCRRGRRSRLLVTPPTVSVTGSDTIDPAPTGTLSFL